MAANYGFDEDKIVKIVTIDKDENGFHRESTEILDNHGNDVIFIDYDGKVLHSYTADGFLARDAMPDNPKHKGLIAQGWNWSFEDAHDYVEKYGALVIGQMYAPEDGATHIMINLDEAQTLPIMFQQTVSEGVEFFWGDGTSDRFEGTGVVTGSHEYAKAGDYELIVKADDGCVVDFGNGSDNLVHGNTGDNKRWYPTLVRGIIFSDKLTSVGAESFNSLEEYIEYAIIPNGIQSLGRCAITCGYMKGLVLPPSMTEFPKVSYSRFIEYISMPKTITNVPDMSFLQAYSLKKLTLPEHISYIGYANFDSPYIDKLVLPKELMEHTEGRVIFNLNYVIKSVDPLPENIEKFESFFGNYMALETITIPASVTSMNGSLLYAYNMKQITMLPTVPPVIMDQYGLDALNGLPATCKIIVPYSEDHSILAAYKAANGWTLFADRIFEAEQ